MAQYIDKNALVAWAEKTYLCENASMTRRVCYKQLLEYINTLEVKEVEVWKTVDMNNINTDLLQIIDKEATEIWQEINTGHKYAIIDSYEQFYGICVQIAETIIKKANKND